MPRLATVVVALGVVGLFSTTGVLWAAFGDEVFLNALVVGLSGCFT
ncbi:hypothetical protein [Coralliovum pocilloporae]